MHGNDVRIAATSNLVVVDKDPVTPGVQGCLFPGDTADISFVAQFLLELRTGMTLVSGSLRTAATP